MISISVDAAEVIGVLRAYEARLSTASIGVLLNGPIRSYLGDRLVERFAYAGDSAVGGPWEPLRQSTINLKASLGYSLEPNERTGELLHVLAYQSDVRTLGEWIELRIPGDVDATVREKIKLAQFGSDDNPMVGAHPTPARPVLGLDEQDEVGIARILGEFFDGLA